MRKRYFVIPFLIYLFIISSCQQNPAKIPFIVKSENIKVILDSSKSNNNEIDSIIAIYKGNLNEEMSIVVGKTKEEIDKQKPSGPLDNLFADMLYSEVSKQVNVDISGCIYNFYGIRRPLPFGNVSKGNIYELMPFNNYSVLLLLNPKGMKAMFDYLYRTGGQPTSNYQIVFADSVNYTVLIGGEKWDTNSSYWVLTSDYAANGGDNMNFFMENDSVINTGILVRDAIFSYMDSLQQSNLFIVADSIPRIIFMENNK